MTQTFKEQLLRYLTGKISSSTGNNEPQFNTPFYMQNDLYTYITDNTVSPIVSKIIRGKTTNNEDLDYYLLIGTDTDDDSGFMIILNYGFTPIMFINQYKSGTKLGRFDYLNVGDDGRFYGVEVAYGTSTRRFVMLNNILANDTGEVILRKSYSLPANLQSGTIKDIIKKPGGSNYLFCMTTDSLYPLAVELKIKVGETNEWNDYTYTTNHASVNGAWCSWDADDNLVFKIVAIYSTGSPNDKLYVLDSSTNTMTIDKQFALPNPTASWIQATILNENNMYLAYCDTDDNGVYNQYVYSITDTLDQIYISDNTDIAMPGYLINSTIYNDGLNVFISFNVPKANNTIEYYMGIVYNDAVYTKNFGALTYTTSQNLFVTNTFHQFNLYTYFLQLGDKCYVSHSIFNNLKYNGLPYNNPFGLNPDSAVLYASYHIPIFARNLYNKVINGNTTISTVEVPNNILNLMNIAEQELFSETNNSLIDNIDSIITNIYETLDINFYNTILMKNQNNPDNIIVNYNGAARLNSSISKYIDYSYAMASKIKINYDDNSNQILTLDPSTQITITNEVATYTFNVYCPTNKNILSIEIVSADEETSYNTITGTFQNGKLYTITQDVYII